jgi:ornithine carbamoyltransferase
MGDEAEAEERRRVFAEYQVDGKLMGLAKSDAIFMHDMPAHRGEEVSEDMLDHPNSVVFQQAENRLHAQKAVMAELFSR